MTRRLRRVVLAELVKLRGLPMVVVTAVGTVVAGSLLAGAFAALAERGGGAAAGTMTGTMTGAAGATLRAIPVLQVGPALLAVLAATTEYDGRQIRTTLTAVPDRIVLLCGKVVAFACLVAAMGSTTLVAAVSTAWWAGGARSSPIAGRAVDLVGATAYLTLVGLVAFAAALTLRSAIASLATVLTGLLILSPILAAATEHARWLPDRAGRLLYGSGPDPVLTATTGTLVVLGWLIAALALAALTLTRRDA